LSTQLSLLEQRLRDSAESAAPKLIQDWKEDNHGDLDVLSDHVTALVEESHLLQTQDKFLATLYLPRIDERQQRIPEAHEKTFQWIYAYHERTTWMRDTTIGNKILWLSGKAGSGKSCLMRFLVNNPATQGQLAAWSGSRSLIVASCFFWKPGTAMQKSLHGMLRSLLYQLCSQKRELMDNADPTLYRALDIGVLRPDTWTDN